MISVEQLRTEVQRLLKEKAHSNFPYEKLAELLTKAEEAKGIRLSVYGFLMHQIEHFGAKAFYSNLVSSADSVREFAEESVTVRDNLPVLLLNGVGYTMRMLENIGSTDLAIAKLEDMSPKYVLYIIFKSVDNNAYADKYKAAYDEQVRRYPDMLAKLPEVYRKAVAE